MVVLYEFFSSQAIENVITCMHFKVDKVVFFEYYDVRRDKKENVKRFLKSYCGVQSVVFQPLPANDRQARSFMPSMSWRLWPAALEGNMLIIFSTRVLDSAIIKRQIPASLTGPGPVNSI